LKAFREKFLGETLNVLFEHRRDHATGFLTGLSDNYIRVLADGDDSLMNEIVPVKIDQMRKGKILGIITEA
jgi:threonylcarbamoyladenosine tRNA methylthiotransferase MtaB